MKIGTTELIVVLLIVVVLFGPTQIPKLTKMLGSSIKNFRDGMKDDDKSEQQEESKPQDEQA
ncbi:MAG: twin-arginine translocase TatA/TatE family subunit [Clostridiales bacterium]|nr:twin-arginine translocase TatA/TatE family subunit [Clostridiales bacterium]MCD7886317.1 twin-arginine translocase TatA/TatE family subunit [Clostridiales bacterium]MCD8052004.1 twin-arginine translocase TatA/TatE family subunit [Clostridiales bacterium]MCD8334212.1 twin-arginine translocase TatA/TatE family subunit [Clostridiales bacterium]